MENSSKPLNMAVVTNDAVVLLQSVLGTSTLQGVALTGICVIGLKVLTCIGTETMKKVTLVMKDVTGKIEAEVNHLVRDITPDIWKDQYGRQVIEERLRRESDRTRLYEWYIPEKTFDVRKEDEKDALAEWMIEEKDNIYKLIRKEKEKLEELARKKKENFAEWKDKQRRDFDERVRRGKKKIADWEIEQKERFIGWSTIVKDELDEWERKEKTRITDSNRDEIKKIEEWVTNKKNRLAQLHEEQK